MFNLLYVSRSQKVDLILFIFFFHFYFLLIYFPLFFYFQNSRVRVKSDWSHCHICHIR